MIRRPFSVHELGPVPPRPLAVVGVLRRPVAALVVGDGLLADVRLGRGLLLLALLALGDVALGQLIGAVLEGYRFLICLESEVGSFVNTKNQENINTRLCHHI